MESVANLNLISTVTAAYANCVRSHLVSNNFSYVYCIVEIDQEYTGCGMTL